MNTLPDWNKARGDWLCQAYLLQANNPKVNQQLVKQIQKEGFMPLYDYQCDVCQLVTEILHKADDNSYEGKRCKRINSNSNCEGCVHKQRSTPGGFRGTPTPKYHGG